MTMIGLHLSTLWLIILATLLGAGLLWFVVPMFGPSRRALLVSFFIIAGGGSAWLSVRYPQLAWLIFFVSVLLAVVIWTLFHKLGKNVGPSTIAWSQYLKGQGALLFVSLLVGGAFAWLSVAYGPYPGRISKGQLLKFENLDPSQHPVYEEVDVENYSDISVFTKSEEPANGSAAVTIYLDHGEAGKLEFGHLDSGTTNWSRWDQSVAGKRLSLVAGPPTQVGGISATKMEILIFLKPK